MNEQKTVFTATGLFSDGTHSLEILTETHSEGLSIRVSTPVAHRFNKVVVQVDGFASVDEIFPASPNFNDVRRIPGWLQAHQGIRSSHADQVFGEQWLFTPAPLVFPMLSGGKWIGIGLGAEPGRNQYVGWTYRPVAPGAFTLEIYYEGQWNGEGHLFTLFVPKTARDKPEEVIADYSNWLRAKGWAPSPKRAPASWWTRPFSQAWGTLATGWIGTGVEFFSPATPSRRAARPIPFKCLVQTTVFPERRKGMPKPTAM